jgi:hypothetical protein
MKMKLVFCILFFIIQTNLSAQKYSENVILECDTLIQTGYFVTISDKKIINELIKNKKREKKGKTYELIYSLSGKNVRFIPFDSIKENDKFTTILDKRFKKNDVCIYTLYNSLNSADFKTLRGFEEKLPSKWIDSISCNYYELVKAKYNYCFQILSMTSQWIRIKVPSLEITYDLVGREANYLKKGLNYYEIYILDKIINYDMEPNLNNIPIKFWKSDYVSD